MNVEPEAAYALFGRLAVNLPTLTMTWVVMVLLVAVAWLTTRRLERRPGRFQALMEMVGHFFDRLCHDTLGGRGSKYAPYIGTLFLFLWISNLIGVVPFFEEPTRDINTPVALAVIAIGVAQISAIRVNGFRAWLAEFFEPAFRAKGMWLPNVFMFPLNVVGEVGKAISLPFRLFGNIFGGAVIILVATWLIPHLLGIPPIATPFLNFFFGIFVGTIQAFVFTMLSLTYVAVAIGGGEESDEKAEES